MAFNWTKVGSNSARKYLFKLDGETGIKVLEYAPIEWPEIKLQFKRDTFYHGVITEAIVGSLSFIKDGKLHLKEIYDRSGVFGECSLRIFYLDETTRTYKELPTSYRIDFNTYRLVKYKKALNAVQINLLPNDLPAKLYQRQDTEVDITKAESLGGQTIDTTRDHWASLKDVFNFPEIKAYYQAEWENLTETVISYINPAKSGAYVIYLPLPLINSDFNEALTAVLIETSGLTLNKNYSIFKDSTATRTMTITGTLVIDINSIIGGFSTLGINIAVINSAGGVINNYNLGSYTDADSGTKTLTVNQALTVAITQSIVVYAALNVDANSGDEVRFDFFTSYLKLTEGETETAATTIEAIPIYEALERNLQLIFDKQYPMYSEFFGRTDVVYNNDGDLYLSENQERFASVMSGLCIRGLKLNQDNNPILPTFKNLFKDCNARWNIGGGFETVGDDIVFRIEEKAHFFQDVEVLDLSDRLWDIEIEQEVDIKKAYAKVSSGYNKYDYFLINGRGEYNTINKRTTEIPNDMTFDNIAPYRGDTRGMTLLLAKPMATTGTEDVRGDEDIFIVKSQRNGSEWDAETDENISVLDNSSLFQIGSLNLFFTPVRNLFRHNYEIMAGLDKRPLSVLMFQSGSKLTTLKTTDGVDTIVENDDIDTADLGNPKWEPENLVVTVSFFEADYQAIKANSKGYLTFSATLKGWIESLVWDLSVMKATIKLRRRWA